MAISQIRESATIHPFPASRARKAGSVVAGDRSRTVTDLRMYQLPLVEFGSGWYHEAAMAEEQNERKQ